MIRPVYRQPVRKNEDSFSGDPSDAPVVGLRTAYSRYREELRASINAALATSVTIEALTNGNILPLTTGEQWRMANESLSSDLERELAKLIEKEATEAGAQIGVSFTLDNPYTLRYLRVRSGDLVRGLDETSHMAVREYLRTSFEVGIPVRRQAAMLGDIAGLLPQQSAALAKFTSKLIGEGRRMSDVERLTKARARRMANYRGLMIARTENTTSQAMGALQSWSIAQDEGLIGRYAIKTWMAASDPWPICTGLNGDSAPLRGYFFSEVLGREVFAPSAHPNCRSALTMRDVTESEYRRLGLS